VKQFVVVQWMVDGRREGVVGVEVVKKYDGRVAACFLAWVGMERPT
jgi:hypothetical protein